MRSFLFFFCMFFCSPAAICFPASSHSTAAPAMASASRCDVWPGSLEPRHSVRGLLRPSPAQPRRGTPHLASGHVACGGRRHGHTAVAPLCLRHAPDASTPEAPPGTPVPVQPLPAQLKALRRQVPPLTERLPPTNSWLYMALLLDGAGLLSPPLVDAWCSRALYADYVARTGYKTLAGSPTRYSCCCLERG